MFTLLKRQRLPLSSLPGYIGGIPVYREYSRVYFGLAPSALAEVLVGELERAQAVKRSGGFLIPSHHDV
jgi:hypothetical protein